MKTGPIAAVVCLALAAGCARSDEAPKNAGEVPLFNDLGSHHHAVSTTDDMAQKYFDQGLRLIFGFNHDEAERAFREAARLDPNLAMAWWGVAYTLGPNYNLAMDAKKNATAVDAVQKAQALQAGASEPERAYIAAIATRYSADPAAKRADLDGAYGEAMKELHRKYPDDNDAAVLYVESLMELKPWQLWISATSNTRRPKGFSEGIFRSIRKTLAPCLD